MIGIYCEPLGIIILILWSIEGATMFFSPGSFPFQRPRGGFIFWAYNFLNLLYEFVIIPLIIIFLLTGTTGPLLATRFSLSQSLLPTVQSAGLVILLTGSFLLCWSRITLKRSFRLGGVPPRAEDRLATKGPYRLVRHPMYTAILFRCFGLALIFQSSVLGLLLVALVVVIVSVMPIEEKQMEKNYGDAYINYAKTVRRIIPYMY